MVALLITTTATLAAPGGTAAHHGGDEASPAETTVSLRIGGEMRRFQTHADPLPSARKRRRVQARSRSAAPTRPARAWPV